MEIRILGPGDEAALGSFLAKHPRTTMFLRSNVARAGLADRGERFQGTYAAAWRGTEITAVAALFWNGNLILEAPEALEEVVRASVADAARPVAGFLGRYAQVVDARRVLGLSDVATTLDSREKLYHLPLGELRVPAALASGRVRCRSPRAGELDRLGTWRHAYALEVLHLADIDAVRREARATVERLQAEGQQWVLEADGRAVSYTAFNAALPDCVQVGGVFTPAELRGRGHARCVVAGSLIEARADGVSDAILFTQPDNASAQAAYESLGFRHVGDYGLVGLAESHAV